MGIVSWWYGPESTTYERDPALEHSVRFGGQTLLQSHYQEIRQDFAAACDEVRLYRDREDDSFARDDDRASVVPDPNDADQAALEALALVGYVDGVKFPVIRLKFGSKRPGELSWDPHRVKGPSSDLHYELSREALANGQGVPPDFDEMVANRGEEAAARLSSAYREAKRRILEAGHGRATPWRRWALLAGAAIWSLAACLLAWLALSTQASVPGLLIAAIALGTSARAAQVRVRNRMQQHHEWTWHQGPVRLRWTSRAAVREVRANSRRDVWVGSITGVAGAAIGAALAWLVPWFAGQ